MRGVTMNFTWLTSFITIVEETSITKAALRLHTSQPALSKQLKNLEAELNVTLVKRTTQGIVITKAGNHLYQRGKQWIQEAEMFKQELQTISEGQQMIIGCLPSIATSLLPKTTNQEHSVFIQNDSDTLIQSLLGEQIDLALVDDFFIGQEILVQPLFTENYFAVFPKNMAPKEKLLWKDIKDEGLILHKQPCDTYHRIMSFARQQGSYVNVKKEVAFGDFLYGYVSAKEGITIVPELIAQNLTSFAVDLVPIEGFERTIALAATKQTYIDQFLTSYCGKLV